MLLLHSTVLKVQRDGFTLVDCYRKKLQFHRYKIIAYWIISSKSLPL